jgi:hypothetical protein
MSLVRRTRHHTLVTMVIVGLYTCCVHDNTFTLSRQPRPARGHLLNVGTIIRYPHALSAGHQIHGPSDAVDIVVTMATPATMVTDIIIVQPHLLGADVSMRSVGSS